MPYEVVHEGEGLLRRFHGVVKGDEVLNSTLDLVKHNLLQDVDYLINDFSEVKAHSIEDFHISSYATVDKVIEPTIGKLKIAIVVANPGDKVLAENYKQKIGNLSYKCEVFTDLMDARDWIRNTG